MIDPGRTRRFVRFARHVAGWLAIGALLGCAPAPDGNGARPTSATAATALGYETPPFYRVDGGDGATLLLLGTIHVGPAAGWTLSPAIEAALARADRFVLEADLRLATEDAVSSLLAEIVLLPPGLTLAKVLAPETLKRLDEEDETVARLGFPRAQRNGMKPWFIAVGLSESIYTESELTGASSTEAHVFASLGLRPLVGLETFEEQLRIFDGLSPKLQDLMLRDTVERLDDAQSQVEDLVTAWRVGDEAALARLAREGIDVHPELDDFYDLLLGDRNRRWVAKLRPLLEAPTHHGETVLVAVGALHLAGKDNLVEQLRAAGFRVEAIDQKKPGPHARRPDARVSRRG